MYGKKNSPFQKEAVKFSYEIDNGWNWNKAHMNIKKNSDQFFFLLVPWHKIWMIYYNISTCTHCRYDCKLCILRWIVTHLHELLLRAHSANGVICYWYSIFIKTKAHWFNPSETNLLRSSMMRIGKFVKINYKAFELASFKRAIYSILGAVCTRDVWIEFTRCTVYTKYDNFAHVYAHGKYCMHLQTWTLLLFLSLTFSSKRANVLWLCIYPLLWSPFILHFGLTRLHFRDCKC